MTDTQELPLHGDSIDFGDFPAEGRSYDLDDGPLCRCGHYERVHDTVSIAPGCLGRVGDEACTCAGFRRSKMVRR